jgi:hypothetical protein
MRTIRTLDDAQLAIRELYQEIDRLRSSDISLKGRKITGAARGTKAGEYATFDQIPKIVDPVINHKDQFYTIVFTKSGTIFTAENIPPFVVGRGREGMLHEVWAVASTGPTSTALKINVQVSALDILDVPVDTIVLDADLEVPATKTVPYFSSTFITNNPKLQRHCWLRPTIVLGSSAADVTIGLVVKRF